MLESTRGSGEEGLEEAFERGCKGEERSRIASVMVGWKRPP